MDNPILQTLVEKVNALDKAIQEMKDSLGKQQDAISENRTYINQVEKDCKTIFQEISFPKEEMQELTYQLTIVANLLRLPPKKEVSHHHHINKGIWISVGLLVIVMVQFTLLSKAWSKKEGQEASDLKYRYLKLYADTGSQRLIFHVDSVYLQDKDEFKKNVMREEDRRLELFNLQQQIEAKDREVKELKEKAKKKS
ncbi:MAG TPA: hypothetical protein VNS32_20195 [Flavisolibacter sp.]|nr:hypothetical protein [Flavisolibacter sp.]